MTGFTFDWQTRAVAAEKTVDVLKRKVLALYQGGTKSSLHRALEMAKQRDERNRQRRELMEMRSAELSRLNAELEQVVERRTHDIKVILDNVTCGFLRVDSLGMVQPGYSQSCRGLFDVPDELAGQPLHALLRIAAIDAIDELKLGIEQVFDDLLPEDVALEQMPRRYAVGERVLEVEGRLIRDADGAPESILYTVTDETDLEQVRAENRQRETLIEILRQRAAFEHFVSDVRSLLGSARDRIANQHHVRRLVHTIKGNSGSWGIDSLSARAHAIENHERISLDDLQSLEDEMRDFLEDNIELAWASYDVCEPAVDVSERELRELRRLIENPNRIDEIEHWVLALLNRPAREFLGPIDALAAKLSDRLSKPVDLRILGADVGVDSEIVGPVLRDISHLVRNAIDHGIEASGERGHKPARGTVSLSIQRHSQGWTIEVEDDGRGIQTARLVERALELGAVTPSEVESMTDEERTSLIFLDGVSTSASTTDISGRGVGMSSVLDAVQRADGKIRTRSGPSGTKFSIELPDSIESARRSIEPSPNRALTAD